jgi:hypothetical protein
MTLDDVMPMTSSGRPGAPRLRASVIELMAGGEGTDSGFEDRVRGWLEQRCEVPPFTCNAPISLLGTRRRLDFYWPELGLNLEADGPDHDLEHVAAEDRRRDAALLARGILPVRVRHDDFARDPHTAMSTFLAHLASKLLTKCDATANFVTAANEKPHAQLRR